jgi:hypothetical protein
MSEDPSGGLKPRARIRRSTLARDVDRWNDAAPAAAPTVGKHTLTGGWSAGYTAIDAIAFFERSLGEARTQIAALARAVAAGDRVAAATTAYSLRRSLRTARDHLGNIPAPRLADRHEQLAGLEGQAGRALSDARATGLVPPEAAGEQQRDGIGNAVESPPRGTDEASSPPALPRLDLRELRQRREAAQQLAARAASALGIPPPPVHIDAHARARTEAHRTIAVMAGGAILLHPERFDPARADALETVAHEMVHVAQLGIESPRADHCGDGDAEAEASEIAAQIAAGIVPDRPTVRLATAEAADGGKRPAPKPRAETQSGMVNARRYLELNAFRTGEAIAQHLVQQRLPQPHPRLAWRNEKLFYQKLFYGLSGILKFQSPFDVAQLLAPGDPYGTVDQHRPLTKAVEAPDSKDDMAGGAVGPWTWSAPVGLAIAQLVEQALIDSLYRLGPRYLGLAEILASDGATVNPADIARSHPMDRFTVGPMCQPGVFAVIAEDKPKTKGPAARLDPKRPITLTWVGRQDKELWNWVRASPADATVEEVSAALFEYMTTHDREARADYYATFLTAAPPMFGIPPQWAKAFEETRDFRPAQIPGADTDPDHQIVALGGSVQADAQALVEIGAAGLDPKAKAQPHPPNEHDNLVADATAQATALKGMLASWRLGGAADKTLAFLARRRAGGAAAAKWVPVLSAQRENLTRIGSGILQLNAAVDQMKLSRTSEQAAPLREIMRFYADATACAHLNQSSNRLILRAANAQTSLTARGLGASLRDMDMSVDMMRSGVAEKDYDRRQLSNAALRLREQATAMQTRMMRGGNVPAEEIEDLQVRVEEAALDAKLIAVEFSLRQLSSAAEEAGAGLAAWIASRFSGKFRSLHDATNKIRSQVSDIRDEWNKAKHYADMPDDNAEVHTNANLRKAVQAAKQRFAELAKREDINEFLREGASIVKWQQFRTACVQVAALIGVSLVGGLVGGMVARGAAGLMMGTGGAAAMESLSLGGAIVARGAGLVTETATQSAGQSLIFGDKLGVAALENLIMNLGSMGVLKALGSKLEEAAKLEKATQGFWQRGAAAGKVVIKETAALTGHALMGAAMGYVAHKIVTGKAQPSPATLEEWLMQGAGIAVGRYAGKAIEASHARQKQLKLQGHAPSMKLATETEKLAALAKRVEDHPQPKDAMELLEKRHEILTEELKGLDDIAKSPELLKRSGMDQKQLASARAAIKHQLAEVHSQGFGDVPLHLAGMKELIPGVLWSGTDKQIEAAIHTAHESGISIKAKKNPQGGKWHVEIEGRKITIEKRFDPRAPAHARPQHERSSHDGHPGAYIVSVCVELAGESHHVRIKALDNGEWIITLCTQCARVRDLVQGARDYFTELEKHPGRDPHGATAPKDVAKIMTLLGDIYIKAHGTEVALRKKKLTEAEAEAVGKDLAQRLSEVVKKSPVLEPLLGVGSRSLVSLEKHVVKEVGKTATEALSTGAMREASLGSKWVEFAKNNDPGKTADELAKAGIDATKHRGQQAIEDLAKRIEHEKPDVRQRAAVEARQAVADEYFRRVEDGATTQLKNRIAELGKEPPNDPVVKAVEKVREAVVHARVKARASFVNQLPLYTNAGDFALRIHNMPDGLRVAEINRVALARADHFGFKYNDAISKLNRRMIFDNRDASLYYSVDTLHGTFEVLNRAGKHQREMNFDGAEVFGSDRAGGHDIRVK